MSTVKQKMIGFRVSEKEHVDFNNACRALGKSPSDLLREIVVALNEGRLTIEQTKTEKRIYR